MNSPELTLPTAPEVLPGEKVTLHFSKTVPGDRKQGLVPYYHYRIRADGEDIGHINLRIGDTEHVRLCAGHVGYEVMEAHRGHHYALEACRALAPFARTLQAEFIITCDPDNHASRRTIELLGAEFIDEIAVPADDFHYARGSRRKRRYRWAP